MSSTLRSTVVVVLVCTGAALPVRGQEIHGRVVDSPTDVPVPLAGVFLLDDEREVVVGVLADSLGRYILKAPRGGEYYVFVQRIGYFETESPLVAISDGGQYELDLEMRPEPIRLDPLEVTVRNEELESFLTLKLGVNPNSIFGYRAIQGARLEEAKFKAVDNTDLLRWVYVPVSHGIEVCVGSFGMPMPDRTKRLERGERQCGGLYVDDHRFRNEHIEEIDMDRIAVVVVLGGSVYLYTRTFEWTMRPGG